MTIAREEYLSSTFWPDEHGFDYECSTCGTKGIRVKSVAGSPWRVTCLNGHEWLLVGGMDIEFIVGA